MSNIDIPFIPALSPEENRDRAENFIKQHGLWGGKLPVNVEILAHKAGYPVNYFTGLKSNFDTKGMPWFVTKNNRLEIFIDNDHYNSDFESCPFTIAEELSHIILHSKIFLQIKTPKERLRIDGNIKESTYYYFEREAKRLASELLLPTNKFYDYIENWLNDNSKVIKDERPANQDDLLNIISRLVSPHLGLSEIIIKRAMIRDINPNFIVDMVLKFGIKYLEDSLSKKPNSFN